MTEENAPKGYDCCGSNQSVDTKDKKVQIPEEVKVKKFLRSRYAAIASNDPSGYEEPFELNSIFYISYNIQGIMTNGKDDSC